MSAFSGCFSTFQDSTTDLDPTTTTTQQPPVTDVGSFADLTNWEALTGRIREETEDPFTGTSAVRMENDSSDNRVAAAYRFDPPLDLTAHHLTVAFKYSQESTGYNLQIHILAPDSENALRYRKRARSDQGWIRTALAAPDEVVGDPDLENVQAITFTQYTGGGVRESIALDDLHLVERPDTPTVVFTFDDGLASVYEKALPILEEFGYGGAVAAIPGRETRSGFMTLEQISDLADRGWDIMSHPQEPEPLPAYDQERQAELIQTSKNWLRSHGFESGARFFVYPYSQWDRDTLHIVSEAHEMGFGGPGMMTWEPPMPTLTTRIKGDDPGTVEEYVDRLVEYGGVMVLMYHAIAESWITESDFRSVVEYIDEQPVDVMTVSEWFEAYSG